MIKRTILLEFIYFKVHKEKKFHYFLNALTILMSMSFLILGSIVSSWNVNAQSIESVSQKENGIQSNLQPSHDEITENAGNALTTESGSSDTSSGVVTDNQIRFGESNSLRGSAAPHPDGDCLFDPSLPKCASDENGNCPEGFGINEDEQCFPYHDRCPEGYHSHEDDESGRCIPDSVPCDPGYIMSPEFPTCEYKDFVCQKHPELNNCKLEGNNVPANESVYNSGYGHGCSDAKISDFTKRYINQPGIGPSYHTQEFMRAYNDGFETCSEGTDESPSTSKGTFKVIVQVTNLLSEDTYGGITINVGTFPESVFKLSNGIYFPAGQTVSKEFTFNSSEVPVGTEFKVNLDYGDGYNQYIYGINTPAKKPEVVQFFIQ